MKYQLNLNNFDFKLLILLKTLLLLTLIITKTNIFKQYYYSNIKIVIPLFYLINLLIN